MKDLAVKLGSDHTFDANANSSSDDINIPAIFEACYDTKEGGTVT